MTASLDGRADFSSLLPIELVTYPAIVARVFGATQAGFEALLALLDSDPGQATDAMMQLIAPERMTDELVAGGADLFGDDVRRKQRDRLNGRRSRRR